MKKLLIMALVGVFYIAGCNTAPEVEKPKFRSENNYEAGRYTYTSSFKGDETLLDTRTGKLWSRERGERDWQYKNLPREKEIEVEISKRFTKEIFSKLKFEEINIDNIKMEYLADMPDDMLGIYLDKAMDVAIKKAKDEEKKKDAEILNKIRNKK